MSPPAADTVATRAVRATPGLARRVRGLSDAAIAWVFIAPTIAILLAINIFPLIWTVYLSFTNYRANQPGRPVEWIGTRNYERLLGSEDIWGYLQVTAHFVLWTMALQVLIGFGLALLINRGFKGSAFWTTLILIPMMLSPAVVGTFWTYIYQPQTGIFSYILDFFAGTDNAHRVLVADWVADDEGTGIVHIAPGFGEDDKVVADAAGIPTIAPVDEKGAFTDAVPPYAGMQVFDANKDIIRDLKARGVIVRHDSYLHSYPHCWRTDTPLIYKAMSSWFVAVTQIKDRMIELNQQINWVPDHVKDGSFGKWLEGARDWSISRNRFWGSPIPVWKSDDDEYPRVDVYGSIAELEADFGVTVTDLHRPMIDDLVRPNPDDPTGKSMMRRIPDVLDCWFESGSMPYAQVHYPFENQDWFENHFPGDFIVEYIGQTRGWFYTLHVLSTALFDKPAFETCVVHGVLLGDDGQKLSKRLKNYPDPVDVFDTIGSDAMRWSLLSSAAVRGGDMVAAKGPMQDAVRQVLLPIWNAWYFLSLYANAGDETRRGRTVAADASLEQVLDRYVLAKTRILVEDVTERMDVFDLSGAASSIGSFLDSLNNWYIRRSRERFWGEDQVAIDVLHTVLDNLCRVAAPLLPLLTEQVWGDLTGGGSVHLADWPEADA